MPGLSKDIRRSTTGMEWETSEYIQFKFFGRYKDNCEPLFS